MSKERPIVQGFTVDPPDSKDLDDAIIVRKRTQGGWYIEVSIADVYFHVGKDSKIDRTAFENAFTRYLPRGNIYMLPHRLTEGELSLLPGKPRNTITFCITLSRDFSLEDLDIRLTQLRSTRLSYKDVDAIIGNTGHSENTLWIDYFELAQGLLLKRQEQGSLATFDLEKGIYTTEEGEIKRIPQGLHYRAHLIVQELMILTNHHVSVYMHGKGVAILFRNHANRQSEVRQQAKEVLQELNMEVTDDVLEQIASRHRQTFQRACYAPHLEGHAGLNLSAYAHWTSPIRRFADLVNQRILIDWILQKPSPYSVNELQTIADHINGVVERVREGKADHFRKQMAEGFDLMGFADIFALQGAAFLDFTRTVSEGRIPVTEDRCDAMIARIEEGTVNVADIACILFSYFPGNKDWEKLKANALRWLESHMDEIFSFLEMAHTFRGLPAGKELEFTRTDTEVSVMFMYEGKLHTSAPYPLGREGERFALFELLRGIANVESSAMSSIKDAVAIASIQNAKGLLLNIATKQLLAPPRFTPSESGPPQRRLFTSEVVFVYDGKEYKAVGRGGTRKEAERAAAIAVLRKLPIQETVLTGMQQPPQEEKAIALLLQLSQARKINQPTYMFESKGPDHAKVFLCTCSFQSKEWKGAGATKAIAKENAANAAWAELNS